MLSRRDAERAGIDVDALTFAGRAMTANGAVATARVRLGRVAFGDLVETGVPASVTAGALDFSLLGMSYLDRFERIEIARRPDAAELLIRRNIRRGASFAATGGLSRGFAGEAPMSEPIVSIRDVRKVYDSGFEALKGVSLDIEEGEVLALLGPNGAGKTTLISMTCGISTVSSGTITVGGHDVVRDFRRARELIGLVPQEVHLDIFAKVVDTVAFSRGLFGKPRDDAYIERLLTRLSLWDKRDAKIQTLSGGMMRRVLIAKALAHQPRVLFLDEPTAGVDVELRKGMWEMVEELRGEGVTIILTTHYIEEAEAIADRVAVINGGRILLVEDKATLMQRMGQKQMNIELQAPLDAVPEALARLPARAQRGRAQPRLHLRPRGRAHRHRLALARPVGDRAGAARRADPAELARGHLRRTGEGRSMNWRAIWAIYRSEMVRTFRTIWQSLVSPVLSTSLYFVVFGSAIGSRIEEVDGVDYGAFIVPGLIMLTVMMQSVSNASFGIYFPKFIGTIYEILSAPISFIEIVIGYVGAAATKSLIIGLIIFVTANFFVTLPVAHPFAMLAFLVLTCVSFSLLGFIIGIWAENFEQLQLVPLLVITPLVFLGGSFYSVDMLPPFWQTVTLFNPVVYLISGFRWSFFGTAEFSVGLSLAAIGAFTLACLAIVWWIFRTGYKLRS